MSKQQRKSRKGEKHEGPLSLYPLTFEQAVTKALAFKPIKPKKKSRPKHQGDK